MYAKLSTLWENIDGCAEHYICATAIDQFSMLSKAFYVNIHRVIGVPEHGRELLDGINSNEESFLSQLMSSVQLTGEKRCDTQMVMHTGTHTFDVILYK